MSCISDCFCLTVVVVRRSSVVLLLPARSAPPSRNVAGAGRNPTPGVRPDDNPGLTGVTPITGGDWGPAGPRYSDGSVLSRGSGCPRSYDARHNESSSYRWLEIYIQLRFARLLIKHYSIL